MTKRDKRLQAIRHNPRDVRFDDACAAAETIGFIRCGGEAGQVRGVRMNAPHYPLDVFWDEGSNAFICIAPDLLGCSAVGDTPEEAVKEMKIAMRLWIDAAQSMGMDLPKSSLRLAA